MTITIRPEHEEIISQAMQSGAYQNADEVIGRALEILHSQDEWLLHHKDSITDKIEQAFAEFERGAFLTDSESRADLERRKAVWLAEKTR